MPLDMNITINTLTKKQLERMLTYFDFYHPDSKSKKIAFLTSDVITKQGKYLYKDARVIINQEAWEKRNEELKDIFYEGNYTIEDKLKSSN